MPNRVSSVDPTLELASRAAVLLLENGQTTEGTNHAVALIGAAFGSDLRLFGTWGQLTVLSLRDSASIHVQATPMGIDIGRVAAAERIVDQMVRGEIASPECLESLQSVRGHPPVSRKRQPTPTFRGFELVADIICHGQNMGRGGNGRGLIRGT